MTAVVGTASSRSLGLLVGDSVNRSLSVGFYLAACLSITLGVFFGIRPPVRQEGDAGALGGLFGVFGSGPVRFATNDERQDSLSSSAVFVVLGLVLVLFGSLLCDGAPSAGLTFPRWPRQKGQTMYLGFPNRSDCDRARELASRSLDGDLTEFDLGVLRDAPGRVRRVRRVGRSDGGDHERRARSARRLTPSHAIDVGRRASRAGAGGTGWPRRRSRSRCSGRGGRRRPRGRRRARRTRAREAARRRSPSWRRSTTSSAASARASSCSCRRRRACARLTRAARWSSRGPRPVTRARGGYSVAMALISAVSSRA